MWTRHPILRQQDLLNSNPQNRSVPIFVNIQLQNTWSEADKFFTATPSGILIFWYFLHLKFSRRWFCKTGRHWKLWDLFVFHLWDSNVFGQFLKQTQKWRPVSYLGHVTLQHWIFLHYETFIDLFKHWNWERRILIYVYRLL